MPASTNSGSLESSDPTGRNWPSTASPRVTSVASAPRTCAASSTARSAKLGCALRAACAQRATGDRFDRGRIAGARRVVALEVLRGEPARVEPRRASGATELGQPGLGVVGLGDAPARGCGVERSEPAQQIVQLVEIARPQLRRSALGARFLIGQHRGIEQLADGRAAEQVRQQPAPDRQELRASFGARQIVVVQERDHEPEQQRRGERRGRARLADRDLDASVRDLVEQLLKPRHLPRIAQALAVGLDEDREIGMAPGHLEQVLRAQPLQVQRRALAGHAPRQQEGARRILAEAPQTASRSRAPRPGSAPRRGRARAAEGRLLATSSPRSPAIGSRCRRRRRSSSGRRQ